MLSLGLCKIFRRGVENVVPELRTEEKAGARGGSRPEPREWIPQSGWLIG